jgi:hypothetical protein
MKKALNEKYKRSSIDSRVREMNENGYETDPNENIVISYLSLRRLIGSLGIALPLILLIASLTKDSEILPSVSHYFHSSMKIIFTGILFSIATFLWTYNGEDFGEKVICKIASILAVLIAVVPTKNRINLEEGIPYTIADFSKFECPSIPRKDWVGYWHLIFAALFFVTLFILIWFKFIPHEKKSTEPNQKMIRIYKVCGIGMLISILLVPLVKILNLNFTSFPPTFCLEMLALLFFGFAWLVKGETIR